MRKIATRELWATQTLLLRWERPDVSDLTYLKDAGRELMRRTDTSPERRSREAYQQSVRRAKMNHGDAIRVE